MRGKKHGYGDFVELSLGDFEAPIEYREGCAELSEEHYVDETQAVYIKRYRKLPKGELTKRDIETHDHPEKWKKLWKYYIEPHQKVSARQRNGLASVIRRAKDERIIWEFLKENPYLLARGVHPAHHGKICIPKPRLGGQLEPDFFVAGLDSAGFSWYGVELESPEYKMFTRAGEETRELKHAIRQIQEWRCWLTENIAFAQNTLGYMYIDANLPCFVFIGRRENEVLDEETLLKRRRAVKNGDKHGLFIHHYEWLLDVPITPVKVKGVG